MPSNRLLPYTLVIALFSTLAACALELEDSGSVSDELALQAEMGEEPGSCSDDSQCGEQEFCNLNPQSGALSCEENMGEPAREPSSEEETIPVDLDNCQGPLGLEYWPEFRPRREVGEPYSESVRVEDSGRYKGKSLRKQPVRAGKKIVFPESICSTESGSATASNSITLSTGLTLGPFSAGAGTNLTETESIGFAACRTQGSVTTIEDEDEDQYCTAYDGVWIEDYEVTNKHDVREWREARMCRKCRVTTPHMCCEKKCGPWAGITGSQTITPETIDSATISVSEPISGTFCRSNQYPPAPLQPNGEAWR